MLSCLRAVRLVRCPSPSSAFKCSSDSRVSTPLSQDLAVSRARVSFRPYRTVVLAPEGRLSACEPDGCESATQVSQGNDEDPAVVGVIADQAPPQPRRVVELKAPDKEQDSELEHVYSPGRPQYNPLEYIFHRPKF